MMTRCALAHLTAVVCSVEPDAYFIANLTQQVAVAQHDLSLVSDRLHEVEQKKAAMLQQLDDARARVQTLTKRHSMLNSSDIAQRLGKDEREMMTEHAMRERHLKFLQDRNGLQLLKLENLKAEQAAIVAEEDADDTISKEASLMSAAATANEGSAEETQTGSKGDQGGHDLIDVAEDVTETDLDHADGLVQSE